MVFSRGDDSPIRRAIASLRDINLTTLPAAIAISRRYRLPAVAAEATPSGLLGLLFGILSLLLISAYPSRLQGLLLRLTGQISRLLPLDGLSQAPAETLADSPTRLWTAIAILLTGWAFTRMVLILMRGLTLLQPGQSRRDRAPWKQGTAAMTLALSLVSLLGISVHLLEGSAQALDHWLAYGAWGGKILLAWGLLTAGFSLLYRWGPRHRSPGQALLPGAGVTAAGTLMGWASLHWLTAVAGLTPVAIATLIRLIGWISLLQLNLRLVLEGASLNLAVSQLRRQRQLHPPVPPLTTAPPSFESFTIRRRGDRLP